MTSVIVCLRNIESMNDLCRLLLGTRLYYAFHDIADLDEAVFEVHEMSMMSSS